MSTKKEQATTLFANGYNCAQAVIGVFAEENGLDKNTALKLANGFGGGLRHGEVCGAVSGAILAIGLRCGFCVEQDFSQKAYCNEKTIEFINRFREKHGSILCRDLLGIDIRCPIDHTTPEARAAHKAVCGELVASAVAVYESMTFEP